MSIPVFKLTGTVHVLKGDISTPVSGALLTFTSNVLVGDLLALDNVSQLVDPQDVRLDRDGKINGDVGIELLANDEALGLSVPIQWTVSAVNVPGGHRIRTWTFEAPAAGVTIDLKDVLHIVGSTAQGIVIGPQGPPGTPGVTGPAGDEGHGFLRRPLRNTFAAIGDSMAAAGSLGNENGRPAELQSYINPTTFQMLQVLTHQRLRYCGGNYAVSASKIAAQLNPQLGYVLAMNPLPGACFLVCGAAEMVENTGYNFATCKVQLESMATQLLAVGIVPILWTIPPASSAAFLVAPAVYRPQIQQWNAWIRLYAERNGFPVVDSYAALADVNGLYPPALTPDNLHPNAEGHKQIVIRALADGLAEIFLNNSLVHTIRSTDDLTNLLNDGSINQGLFTSDSNSDGIADGWTQSGTSTNTLVAPVPTDQLLGNWQQLTVAAGNTGSLYKNFTGWSVGDKLAVAVRVQSSNMVASVGTFSLGVQASIPGGLTLSDSTHVTTLFNGIGSWPSADLTDGEVYVEFTVPAGTTQLSFQGSISSVTSGTATLRFGEATVRNLTTGDLLT